LHIKNRYFNLILIGFFLLIHIKDRGSMEDEGTYYSKNLCFFRGMLKYFNPILCHIKNLTTNVTIFHRFCKQIQKLRA
jgi:hypothetical protein